MACSQLRLGWSGAIVEPTRLLHRGSFAQTFGGCKSTVGSEWPVGSSCNYSADLCCESRPSRQCAYSRSYSADLCCEWRALSIKLSFHPLSSQRKPLRTEGRAIQDGRPVAPLSTGYTDEAPAEIADETEQEKEEHLSVATLIWRAVKLPIYSVCIIPLTVGAAAAYSQTGVFTGGRYWLMLWSSVLIITWLNLSNDAYDAETGVDKYKKESVVNITGSQKGVILAAFACLVVGLVGLITGASQAGDMRVAALLVLAVACGYVYQCPPFRLSYKGLGEPLCFFAFGPFATTAFYLSQAHPSATAVLPVTAAIFGASVLVGITTSLILFCSHFHQIEGDTAAGKLSPLVRLGTEKGAKVVQAAVIGLYMITASLSVCRNLPFSCPMFVLLTVPIGKLVVDFVQKNHTNKEVIFMAKYFAVRLHVAFGLALTLGFLASKLPPSA